MTGSELIAAERQRQIEVEGWTSEHDAQPNHALDLMKAAQAYYHNDVSLWPWHEGWKPRSAFRNLVRAGALFQAALDTGSIVALSGNAEGHRNMCAQMLNDLIFDVLTALDLNK